LERLVAVRTGAEAAHGVTGVLGAVRRIGQTELEPTEARREVGQLRGVAGDAVAGTVRAAIAGEADVVEHEGRRLSTEHATGGTDTGARRRDVAHGRQRVRRIAEAELTEAAADIRERGVDLVVSLRLTFQLDAGTYRQAVVETRFTSEVDLDVLLHGVAAIYPTRLDRTVAVLRVEVSAVRPIVTAADAQLDTVGRIGLASHLAGGDQGGRAHKDVFHAINPILPSLAGQKTGSGHPHTVSGLCLRHRGIRAIPPLSADPVLGDILFGGPSGSTAIRPRVWFFCDAVLTLPQIAPQPR